MSKKKVFRKKESIRPVAKLSPQKEFIIACLGTHASFNREGDIVPSAELGLYSQDCRYLSTLSLYIEGVELETTFGKVNDFGSSLTIRKTAKLSQGEGYTDEYELALDEKISFTDPQTVIVSLTIQSFHHEKTKVTLGAILNGDFLDMLQVRGILPNKRGKLFRANVKSSQWERTYLGLDGVTRKTSVTCQSARGEIEYSTQGMRWQLELQPNESAEMSVQVKMTRDDQPERDWSGELRQIEDLRLTRWCTTTDNQLFDRMFTRSQYELSMLSMPDGEGGLIPAAALPYYACMFGRDSLIGSSMYVPFNPAVLKSTLYYLADNVGKKVNSFYNEEPGRVLHEARQGELARAGLVRFGPKYFGTIDGNVEWLNRLYKYYCWTGDLDFVREQWGNVGAIAQWVIEQTHQSSGGLLTYYPDEKMGLVHKDWMDSRGSSGEVPKGPYAAPEVQACYVAACSAMKEMALLMKEPEMAAEWDERGRTILATFLDLFWWEEEGCFFRGIDGPEQNPIKMVGSNSGQCLYWLRGSKIPASMFDRIVARLNKSDMNAGVGLQTLSSQDPWFNPYGYHLGPPWMHDFAMFIIGLCHNLKYKPLACKLSQQLADVTGGYSNSPELWAAIPGLPPAKYPTANAPQYWASGAAFEIVVALLGFKPDVQNDCLHLVAPMLPASIKHMEVNHVFVGGKNVHIVIVQTPSGGLAISPGEKNEAEINVIYPPIQAETSLTEG